MEQYEAHGHLEVLYIGNECRYSRLAERAALCVPNSGPTMGRWEADVPCLWRVGEARSAVPLQVMDAGRLFEPALSTNGKSKAKRKIETKLLLAKLPRVFRKQGGRVHTVSEAG